jgi:hypothetical protein
MELSYSKNVTFKNLTRARKVSSSSKKSKLYGYYLDKWAEPSTRANTFWDKKVIFQTNHMFVCSYWMNINWKAELPKTQNDRIISTNVKRAVWARDKGVCVLCGSN